MVLVGKNAVSIVRQMMGPTNPSESPSGTIRGDFGIDLGRNVIHGSDTNPGSNEREINLFFDELEFSQAHDLGGPRPDLPVGPIMDFLLELIDRTIACEGHLVVGSTGFPDTLRHGFAKPGRLERIVEVTPSYPDDVISALEIHAVDAEARAGRPLFDQVDWKRVVGQAQDGSTGDWVRLLHGVLRHKARVEASGESASPITTADLDGEVGRFSQAQRRIRVSRGGNYV